MIRRAIISVHDKTGLIELGRGLAACGIEIIASGGTAAALLAANIPVIEVSEYTGAPEMLGGRVKTLHPKIHGGILARRDDAAHVADLAAQQIGAIDLVIVNLYPFEATIAQPDVTHAQAIEQIDIGGPTLMRAAAKNHRDVVVITAPADYDALLAALQKNKNTISAEWSSRLAASAFARIAAYDAAISNYFAGRSGDVVQSLRYGENPHQTAVWCTSPAGAPWIDAPLQGKELSYNNLLDIDAAVQLAWDLDQAPHAVAIIKHGNPCGVGVSDVDLPSAYRRALSADPLSAFGGIVVTTTPIDAPLASALCETFYEVICAPEFSTEALEKLATKKNLRVVRFHARRGEKFLVRSACGGVLRQSPDNILSGPLTQPSPKGERDYGKVVSKRAPTADELVALDLAWRICKHVHSNAIVLATRDMSCGVGAGQMSRLDSVQIAAARQRQYVPNVAGVLVAASDAFFPFRDGIDAIAATGATAIIHPGGSLRDAEVFKAADEQGLAMIVTGVRHFRH